LGYMVPSTSSRLMSSASDAPSSREYNADRHCGMSERGTVSRSKVISRMSVS
jgi:hypothetical protein